MTMNRLRDAAGRFDTRPTGTLLERFEGQVSPEPMSGCWLWTGALHGQFGYGSMKLGNRATRTECAHRISYRLFKGEIPTGLFVRHDCDNPACVNPAHLRLGTALDNSHDAISRGRHCHGERHYMAKADEALVREIRSQPSRAAGVAVGVRAGISRQSAHDILSRRTWKTVK